MRPDITDLPQGWAASLQGRCDLNNKRAQNEPLDIRLVHANPDKSVYRNPTVVSRLLLLIPEAEIVALGDQWGVRGWDVLPLDR